MLTKNVKQLITCPIHLALLNEPVQLKCQHAFCRSCILRCMERANLKECPICRQNIEYSCDEISKMSASLIHNQLIETYKYEKENSVDKMKNLEIRVSLLGSMSTGKSSIMRYLAGYPMPLGTITTVGVDYTEIDVNNNDTIVKVHLWDTAGQEVYRTMIRSYYRNSKGIMVVFDVTNSKTFEDIESWLYEIRATNTDDDLIIILVGNKTDLEQERVVSFKSAQAVADRFNLIYFETSAKTGKNLTEMLEILVAKIVNTMKMRHINSLFSISNIKLNKQEKTTYKKRSGCCS